MSLLSAKLHAKVFLIIVFYFHLYFYFKLACVAGDPEKGLFGHVICDTGAAGTSSNQVQAQAGIVK